MSEFWLWFWKPVAEFLGAIFFIGAALFAIFIFLGAWVVLTVMIERFKKFWRGLRGQP